MVWALVATVLTAVARGEPTSCPGIAPTVRRWLHLHPHCDRRYDGHRRRLGWRWSRSIRYHLRLPALRRSARRANQLPRNCANCTTMMIVTTATAVTAQLSLILGYTYILIAIVDMTAIAGALGGGGLGQFAITYGATARPP
jgi:hypothetical protein